MQFRLGSREDLRACKAILRRRQPQAVGPVLEEIGAIWAGLLAQERILFYVVVPEPSAAPVGFHMTAFIDEGVVEELQVAGCPGAVGRLLARHRAGEAVFLDAGEIARANAEGSLNLFVLHCLMDEDDMSSPRAHAIATGSAHGFFFTHGGFRARRLIEEVFDDGFARFLEAGGIMPWSEYRGTAGPGARFHGLCAEQVVPGAGSPFGTLFHSPVPRLGFTPAEQRVLSRALLDASDVEIAAGLGVSMSAVRQAWRGVFQRVAAVLPGLVDESVREVDSLARGREKRRKILAYLRQNPHELRPCRKGRARENRRVVATAGEALGSTGALLARGSK